MDETKYKPKYPVLTLEKALEIINYFKVNSNENGISLSEICQNLNMKKSSVHRILDTLYEYNYVEKTMFGNRYKLGWELYNIGSTIPFHHNLSKDTCNPILNELCQKHSESFSIGILDNNVVGIIYNEEPNITLKASTQIGERQPLYATAKGKLFLSQFPDNKIYDFYRENKIETFTCNTLITPRKMLKELCEIREYGYSMDREEHCDGLTCISMPIRNVNGLVVATISASGPTHRILYKISEGLKKDLSKASKKLSCHLGYNTNIEIPNYLPKD